MTKFHPIILYGKNQLLLYHSNIVYILFFSNFATFNSMFIKFIIH